MNIHILHRTYITVHSFTLETVESVWYNIFYKSVTKCDINSKP